jgi:hypothetical protein
VTIKDNESVPAQDTASVLFGMSGVEVTEAEREADGRLTIWGQVVLPAVCPVCGTVSEHAHQYVTASPRDVRACGQDVGFCLVKRPDAVRGGALPEEDVHRVGAAGPAAVHDHPPAAGARRRGGGGPGDHPR